MQTYDEIFSSILEESQSLIRAYIAGMGVAFDQADDLAQEVFIHYYKDFDKKPAEIGHIPWLKGIAKNYCMRHFEQNKKEKQNKEKFMRVLQLVQNYSSDIDPSESSHLIDRLKDCLKMLSSSNFSLLRSKYENGLSYEEIGRELNTTSDAVGMILMRIRKSLQKCIKKDAAYEL